MIRFKSNELSWDGFLVPGIHGSIVRDIHCAPQYSFTGLTKMRNCWNCWNHHRTAKWKGRCDSLCFYRSSIHSSCRGWSRHVPPKIKLHNHIGVRPFSLLRVRMVISATPKTSCHTRLISLPYKTLYLIVTAEEQWYWLKASEATSSSSPSVIIPWLGDLRNLYECIDNLFLLLFTHEFCPMNFGKNGMKNC